MKSLLLDSHILLWSLAGDPHLSKSAERLIYTTPRVYVSTATLFELRTKAARGKLKLPDDLDQMIQAQNFALLDLSANQLLNYRIFHKKNSDPFDNLLLTIAEAQHFQFLTADKAILALQSSYPWIIDGS